MKNLISVAITGLMVASTFLSGSNATQEIVETDSLMDVIEEPKEEVHILTDEELSRLYTCKPEVRKEDDSIVELSQEDAWLLMRLGASESGNCGEDAQYLTMMVVINRLKDENFPNTISEIIHQDSQFAVVDNGVLAKTEPNVDSHLALARIEEGEDVSFGAIYFEASSNTSESWHKQNRKFLYECYGQRYYK